MLVDIQNLRIAFPTPSGPVEAAFTAKAMGWEVPPERRAMAGFGDYDTAMKTLEQAITDKRFIAGDRFTAADLVAVQSRWRPGLWPLHVPTTSPPTITVKCLRRPRETRLVR